MPWRWLVLWGESMKIEMPDKNGIGIVGQDGREYKGADGVVDVPEHEGDALIKSGAPVKQHRKTFFVSIEFDENGRVIR